MRLLSVHAKKQDEITDEMWQQVNPFNREMVLEFIFGGLRITYMIKIVLRLKRKSF